MKKALDSVRTWVAERVCLGLPIMKLIGKIQTDYDHNRMCFPVSDVTLSKEANIYAYEKGLYMRIKLNGIDFTANLDTGSGEYIEVDSAFYEKHQKEMPIGFVMKKNRFGVAVVHQARMSSYKSLKNPVIIFDNKLMQPPTIDDEVRVYSVKSIAPLFDGFVGYRFYRSIGKKVLLDLDNMRLEAVQ